MAKALGVKAFNDPEVKKMTDAALIAAVRNGSGKMQPFKDKLTDAEIRSAVEYFRSFR